MSRLYILTVLGGALTWMMFGLSVGMILQAIDAGEPQNRLQVMMAGVWLLMGVGDVWWLLHFGSARPLQPSSPPAPAG